MVYPCTYSSQKVLSINPSKARPVCTKHTLHLSRRGERQPFRARWDGNYFSYPAQEWKCTYLYQFSFLSDYYSGWEITCCFFISHFVSTRVWGRGKKVLAIPSDFRIIDEWQARESSACWEACFPFFPTVMLKGCSSRRFIWEVCASSYQTGDQRPQFFLV